VAADSWGNGVYASYTLLTDPESRKILRRVILDVERQYPFEIDAWVLLPDHLHCVWTLPDGEYNFSKRWGLIKAGFTKAAKTLFHRNEWMNQ
jgi:putative transposase